MARKTIHLLSGHLEDISWEIFEEAADSIARLVEKRNGIYALYGKGRLYYVGLARNLKVRLKAHLKDRHNGLWDRFSVYLTNESDHLRELETLLLRVIKPEGNKVKGRLKGSEDLKRALDRAMRDQEALRRQGLLGTVPRRAKGSDPGTDGGKTTYLRSMYKGRLYKATLRKDGTVKYNGKVYASLSAAGSAVVKRSCNGWLFWRYKDEQGTWVKMTRKK